MDIRHKATIYETFEILLEWSSQVWTIGRQIATNGSLSLFTQKIKRIKKQNRYKIIEH
jgi:hypothetical protein